MSHVQIASQHWRVIRGPDLLSKGKLPTTENAQHSGMDDLIAACVKSFDHNVMTRAKKV